MSATTVQILRQITTKVASSCDSCIHAEVCDFYRHIEDNMDINIDLSLICKHAEEIIIQENKND